MAINLCQFILINPHSLPLHSYPLHKITYRNINCHHETPVINHGRTQVRVSDHSCLRSHNCASYIPLCSLCGNGTEDGSIVSDDLLSFVEMSTISIDCCFVITPVVYFLIRFSGNIECDLIIYLLHVSITQFCRAVFLWNTLLYHFAWRALDVWDDDKNGPLGG